MFRIAPVVILFLFSCASPSLQKKKDRDLRTYPTPEHFEDLLSEHVEKKTAKVRIPEKSVIQWEMKTVRPKNPRSPAILGDETLRQILEDNHATASSGDQCLAQETKAFWLEKRALPSFDLRQFISAWCDVHYDWSVVHYMWKGKVPKIKLDASTYGLVRHEAGEKSWLFVVHPRRLGELTVLQSADEIVLRGRLRPNDKKREVDSIGAVSTTGTYGYEYCQPNEEVEVPDFELACSVNEEEDLTRVSLYFSYKGVRSSRAIINRGFFSSGKPISVYRSPELRQAVLAAVPVAFRNKIVTEEEFRRGVVESINAVRNSFGVVSASLSTPQSEVVARAISPLGATYAANQFEKYNLILAGLEAGWELQAKLMDSTFTGFGFAENDQLGFVEKLFLSASNRASVLNPNTTHFAVGTKRGKTWSRGMLFSYAELPNDHINRYATKVVKRINQIRQSKGLSKAVVYKDVVSESRELSKKLRDGKIDLDKTWREFADIHSAAGIWRGRFHWGTISDISKKRFGYNVAYAEKIGISVVAAPVKDKHGPFYSFAYVAFVKKR